MYLRLLMGTPLNPADYEVPSDYSIYDFTPGIKPLLAAIQDSLSSSGEIYLTKVDLHISRECEADEYFLNIGMYNMYTLLSGESSLDYRAYVGL